ncbi:MAG: hypothetical protein ABIP79_16680 [Chitinophagaceae bacterium]
MTPTKQPNKEFIMHVVGGRKYRRLRYFFGTTGGESELLRGGMIGFNC